MTDCLHNNNKKSKLWRSMCFTIAFPDLFDLSLYWFAVVHFLYIFFSLSFSFSSKLGQSENEMQTVRQLLAESQQIVKQSIEKPLANDARDEDIVALRARVDELAQENVELSQKVSYSDYLGLVL
jgi:hypothetical protein